MSERVWGRQTVETAVTSGSDAYGPDFYRALMRAAFDAVIVVDRAGLITYQSPPTERLLGYPPGSVLGRRAIELIHADDRPRVERLFHEASLAPARPPSAEVRLRHGATADWHWIEVTATALFDDPAVRGMVLNTDSIQHRKELELRSVEARLDPHFLYNALHLIAALVEQGQSAEAVDGLGRLRDLLGAGIAVGERELISLPLEMQWVEDYLVLQQLRFGGRLRVRVAPLPTGLQGFLVPKRLLQPLVENAVKHGADRRAGPTWIQVRARRSGARVVLLVVDGGEGGPSGKSRVGFRVGLESVRQRLRLYYGDSAGFRLRIGGRATAARVAIVEEGSYSPGRGSPPAS